MKMVYRYTPVLRWKRGERVGVENLSAEARRDVVPLFVRGGEKYVGKKATKSRAAIEPAEAFAGDIEVIWGRAPFFLDASALTLSAAGHHPLIDMGVSARTRGLHLVPGTRLDAPQPYRHAVDLLIQQDRHGVALRVDLQELTSAAIWAPNWPYPLGNTDLLVDLADNVRVAADLGAALDPAFRNLHRAGQWRSVTVVGSSMPENFMGFLAGHHTIARDEFRLWQRLSSVGLSYQLDYGDYATVAVVPPPAGIKWGYPINVRYTLDGQFLICRGVRTTGPLAVDPDVQLRDHARAIVAYPGRSPLAHCWADTLIDNISNGSESRGGLERWVQIGVNRHIELTRNRIP